MRAKVLGVPVDVMTREETVEAISSWIKGGDRNKMLVTAYSEFFVNALSDSDFRRIVTKADLVTPDGYSVLGAVKYLELARNVDREKAPELVKILKKLWAGLRVGGMIWGRELGQTVTGVWLFEELCRKAEKGGWKVFLLGGWEEVAMKATTSLLKRFPNLKVEYDEGERLAGTDEAVNRRVIEKINRFKPDILFVAYNPIKQEKWIDANREKLKVGMAMGVGGTYNEYLGKFKKAPEWMEEKGLKWLWRLLMEPGRYKRIFRAVFVFPVKVFQSSL